MKTIRLFRALILAFAATTASLAAAEAQACAAPESAFRDVLKKHLDARKTPEGITGIVAHVECGRGDAPVAVAVGSTARDGLTPMTPETLFEIGSNTKHFTSALVGRLVDAGKLTLDDPLSKYLPQYPYWGTTTIRSLLDMTSPIPSYDQTMAMSRDYAAEPYRHYTLADLVDYVTPDKGLPKPGPWFYSNTNYILAGMIIEAVTERPYTDMLREEIGRAGLRNTFYFPAAVAEDVLARMASGYMTAPGCPDYEPNCTDNPFAPLTGVDVKEFDLSWAGPAGGIVASTGDLARWVRVLFGGEVVSPASLAAMKRVVSMTTGKPLEAPSTAEPRAFGLGLAQVYNAEIGTFWFYQGETMGYRAVFALFPESDILITFALNSAPADAESKVGDLVRALHKVASGG